MNVARLDAGEGTPPAMVRLLMHFAEVERASFTGLYASEG
jgi:hypothetical protein